MNIWTEVKAWWSIFVVGLFTAPKPPEVETLTDEELEKLFAAEEDEEWDE